MADFDVQAALKPSVDEIAKTFGDLSDEQLKALHDAEGKTAKPRSTLTGKIDAELAARGETAKAKAAEDAKAAAAKDGIELFTRADLDKHLEPLSKRVAKLETQLADAQGSVAAKAVTAERRVLAVTGEADGDLVRVAFTDAAGNTLEGLPDLEFDGSAFSCDAKGETVTLKERISFPESTPRSEIAKVWLLGANGKAASSVELVNPLPVGGGTAGCIPAGHLAFRLK